MNRIIEYGSVEAIPLYNCSAMPADEWTNKFGLKRPVIGSISLGYGLVFEFLFIPCLLAMLDKDLYRMPCYKIMLIIGINDMFALAMNSILTGLLAIRGAVFCTYPTLIYVAGVCGLGLWGCSCLSNVILLINRIANISNSSFNNIIFQKNRTFIVFLLPILYGFYLSFFTTTCVFSSRYYAWFYDPLIFPNRSAEYTNIPHGINNMSVMVGTFVLYAYICYELKKSSNGTQDSRVTVMSNRILYQAVVICAINQIASTVYVVMNFIVVPEWLTIFAQLLWQLDHGCPVIIYLTMNPTMRERFVNKLRCRSSAKKMSINPYGSSKQSVLG